MSIQDRRTEALEAVEKLAEQGITDNQIVRVVAFHLGESYRDISDLDALLRRIKELMQIEAAQADGPGPQSPRP